MRHEGSRFPEQEAFPVTARTGFSGVLFRPLAAQFVPIGQAFVDFPFKTPFRRPVELAAGHVVRKVVLPGESVRRVMIVCVILSIAQFLH